MKEKRLKRGCDAEATFTKDLCRVNLENVCLLCAFTSSEHVLN